jgi:dual specificity tyrosine-phosphorylation-regulated kinase 1
MTRLQELIFCIVLANLYLLFCLQQQILGMVPNDMLKRADQQHRTQFFEKQQGGIWTIRQTSDASQPRPSSPILPSLNPIASLKDVVAKKTEPERAQDYDNFVDMIFRMLTYDPKRRISPEDALRHAFITNVPPEP